MVNLDKFHIGGHHFKKYAMDSSTMKELSYFLLEDTEKAEKIQELSTGTTYGIELHENGVLPLVLLSAKGKEAKDYLIEVSNGEYGFEEKEKGLFVPKTQTLNDIIQKLYRTYAPSK
jgi:hypothetical protein